ncbi:uncharacterized protein A1O5_05578 [Cladophialophora psammophila CBS 110553]|uniref:C2H2-type domain-containing protein n=1 Tax=Cladophialophora psammophila CBS 110553 TaxID=1182543 RepID=W9WUX4_9EURO|nr:uncharacterized protein A1O5_05578 [Cladophialophora psammophila CBS 110553]EXJ71768.1 hypothetical protein A1O5_05578 [Cladophialophora psammophila CBS 110553]
MACRPLGSGAFSDHPFQFSPFQPATLVRQDVDEELKREPAIVESVQHLLELDLDLSKIFKLRQTKYLNALHLLTDADEGDICAAFRLLSFGNSQRLPQNMSTRLSQQSYAYPPSRVPSLVSDRSSLRLSANLGVPIHDPTRPVFGYVNDMSPMPSQLSSSDDMFRASIGCIQHTSMDYLATSKEGLQFYATNPHLAECVAPCMQRQSDTQVVAPPASQTAFEMPLSTSAVDELLLPSGGERQFWHPDTLVRPSFITEHEPTPNRNRIRKFKCPCPEDGCTKDFLSPKELAKHLTANHDQNSTFCCKHCDYPQTHRPSTWKRHHSTRHSKCEGNGECLEEICIRERKHWACGLCVNLEKDVGEFATHYKRHFEHGNVQKSDISVSTIIRSLLTQDATRDKWSALNVDIERPDGTFRLSWDAQKVTEIREALEYETFRDSTFDEAGVVDRLLQEVLARATYH